jgi:hypothetical protein
VSFENVPALTITMGSGNDDVEIRRVGQNAQVTILGGDGDDTVRIDAAAAASRVSFDGGDGYDRLIVNPQGYGTVPAQGGEITDPGERDFYLTENGIQYGPTHSYQNFEYLILHQGGTRIDMTIVAEPSTTGDNGLVVSLPASKDWVHEWQSFWVEIWVSTPESTALAIAEAAADLHYDTRYVTVQEIEYGPAFTEGRTGTIDDALGRIYGIGGQTLVNGLGQEGYVLLARVRFASTANDLVTVDEVQQHIGPYDVQWGLSYGLGRLASGDTSLAALGQSPGTEMWAVMYDIDDNDRIDFGDLSYFAAAFGRTVGSTTEPPYVQWADFDRSGRVDFGDLAFFAPNFGKSRAVGEPIVFPPSFPGAWGGGADVGEGESFSGAGDKMNAAWSEETPRTDTRSALAAVLAEAEDESLLNTPWQLELPVSERHWSEPWDSLEDLLTPLSDGTSEELLDDLLNPHDALFAQIGR